VRSLTRRGALAFGGVAVVAATLRRAGGALVIPSAVPGCASTPPIGWRGVDVSSGEEIRIVSGAMPRGAVITGGYASPQLGRLELGQMGTSVSGMYRSSATGEAGVLQGKATGNLVEFEWWGSVGGDGAVRSLGGRGFFLFDLLSAGSRARLFGRRSFGASSVSWSAGDGEPWTAARAS
jgi:hypothetical protein